MQQPNAGSTRARFALRSQLALVLFFRPSTSANTPLALMVVMPAVTCAGGVFPQSTSAFTNEHIATCTVW